MCVTVDCTLSRLPSSSSAVNDSLTPMTRLFISRSPMVDVPWPNFPSPELDGTKFQLEVPIYFRRCPNFPKTQCRISRGKPILYTHKKPARSMQPFQYNTGMWQTHKHSHIHSPIANTCASIASRVNWGGFFVITGNSSGMVYCFWLLPSWKLNCLPVPTAPALDNGQKWKLSDGDLQLRICCTTEQCVRPLGSSW